jgi:pyruvate dehydrogenase E2 component (dihydrolipoamide acetyltransferase)
MADFTMPALGADMETAQVVEWRVLPGARVKPGDVVAVVETHKGAIDVECFLDGVIDDLAPLGQSLPVGALLAHVRVEGEAVAAPAAPAVPPVPAMPVAAPVVAPMVSLAPAAATRARVSPAARRRAQQLGVDADSVPGSGGDGAVTLADVERAAAQPQQAPPPPARRGGFDPAQMRQAIAAAMARSKREIPHYYLTSTVDFAAAGSWLAAYNAEREPVDRLLPAVLLLKATAKALAEVPQLNGFFENGAYRAGPGIHVGWAIALRGGGLVAPALHHADRQSLDDLMRGFQDLVKRARAWSLRSSEVSDPTVTITSLGERGVESVFGIITPPQLALVGFGTPLERPWVVEGQVVPRPLITATLSGDHRATDGHRGALYLAAVDRMLQQPEEL